MTTKTLMCSWFTLCERQADGLRDHSTFGILPICTRCADRTDAPLTPHEVARLHAIQDIDERYVDVAQEKAQCPVCTNVHVSPGERALSGEIIRPCSNLSTDDPVYRGSLFYTGDTC
jgi:hypothetical protein